MFDECTFLRKKSLVGQYLKVIKLEIGLDNEKVETI